MSSSGSKADPAHRAVGIQGLENTGSDIPRTLIFPDHVPQFPKPYESQGLNVFWVPTLPDPDALRAESFS